MLRVGEGRRVWGDSHSRIWTSGLTLFNQAFLPVYCTLSSLRLLLLWGKEHARHAAEP